MKRSRGRSRKNTNSSNRQLDSNGPDVKIRGNASHIYDKYQALARDAASSGDRVIAENYLQHAEHYFRIMRASGQTGKDKPGATNSTGVNGESAANETEAEAVEEPTAEQVAAVAANEEAVADAPQEPVEAEAASKPRRTRRRSTKAEAGTEKANGNGRGKSKSDGNDNEGAEAVASASEVGEQTSEEASP